MYVNWAYVICVALVAGPLLVWLVLDARFRRRRIDRFYAEREAKMIAERKRIFGQ